MNIKTILVLSIFCLLSVPHIAAQVASRVELAVDKTVLSLPCRHRLPAKYRSCPDGMTLNVRTSIKGKPPKNVRYEYSVSYGRILGKGSDVVWDMTNQQPGTYEITARVYDGSSEVGSPVTKTIKVEECIDCNAECLSCPKFSIRSSKASGGPGDTVDFRVEDTGDLRYRWTIVGGRIIKGQGTENVTVKINNKAKDSVLVSADVLNGGFCLEVGGCPSRSEFQLPLTNPKGSDSLEVTLDSTHITLPCPPGCQSKSGDCPIVRPIKVHATVSDPNSGSAQFTYKVSGGTILGSGDDVQWDLSNVHEGIYQLTVKTKSGMRKSVQVKVNACPDCLCDYFCPSISVSGPSTVIEAGSIAVFTANVQGGPESPIYKWKVSGGKIVSGQGTPSIEVKTKHENIAREVTASLEIKGRELLLHDCTRVASGSAIVQPIKP